VWLQLGRSAVAKAQKVEASSLVATRRPHTEQPEQPRGGGSVVVVVVWLVGEARGDLVAYQQARVRPSGMRGNNSRHARERERETEERSSPKEEDDRRLPALLLLLSLSFVLPPWCSSSSSLPIDCHHLIDWKSVCSSCTSRSLFIATEAPTSENDAALCVCRGES